ncbi:Mitochondrial carrier-like protein 1 [Heterocephalus glaber]|uniref:Mitochondrial carrier homolog 1 n=1 Tax=Heterocephalus glaber TaxID=10181 RepID=G5B535_HETGA|nr:Mitochondrial carrier-like protein 1 [Heterocephalus glaber]
MDGASGGLGSGDSAPTTEALFVALGAGVTALSHPLLYVKLLIQVTDQDLEEDWGGGGDGDVWGAVGTVGHEPMPPTLGTNVLGRKVLYLPSFFTYAKYIVQVDGKIGLFRGLSPRLMSNALSTVTRGSMKKVFPPDEIEQASNKDDMKTSLRKVVKETSYEMMMQCVSRMLAHPLHVISMRCMVQFVGREAKYSGVLSSIGKIFKEEGLLGFFVGLIPHLLGDVVFLWGCNLLAHFINAYLVDDSVSDSPGGLGNDQNPGSQFSQALAIRSYTKFVMGIAVSMLTYPFLLVGDLMAVNNCGLQAGLPPYSPVFKSWIHCWKYLSVQFSQALAIRSYTKFVMGIAVSMLTYPFLLVGDLMAVNNCGLQAGLPPYSPVFKSWIHCWKYLSVQGQLFRGSSLLFRRVSSGSCFALE